MRYVILRDDDTSALTPVDCLERLYRPFLDRRLPVNLATIPNVRTDATRADGKPEGFLFGRSPSPGALAIGENRTLLKYLRANPGLRIVQHGYDHSLYEFETAKITDARQRLQHGADLFAAAGFGRPQTFVAPYDRYTRTSLREISRHFRIFSTGWFELRRLPQSWWPLYAFKKLFKHQHWRVGSVFLLSHPGCILSRLRPRTEMLETIKSTVMSQSLTVLVTHAWEYFQDGKPDQSFIDVLHHTAEWLAEQTDVRVIGFDDLPKQKVKLG